MRRAWRGARRVLLVLAILFIAVVIYRIPAVQQKTRSQQMVAQILAQKLTPEDVDGKHLPPPPDPTQVDATVAGADANANGIRDDVELAIFQKYPSDEKLRAAELQYAMALQTEFTKVFDSPTLVADIEQEGRGYLCINNDSHAADVEKLVANTDERKQFRESIRSKWMTSYKIGSQDDCDI